jgi:hypothetical protein
MEMERPNNNNNKKQSKNNMFSKLRLGNIMTPFDFQIKKSQNDIGIYWRLNTLRSICLTNIKPGTEVHSIELITLIHL